jgi:dTDP-glucose pyrophosphorylase
MNNNLMIRLGTSLKEAMKKLEETEQRILFVVDEHNRLAGTLTDGDIRRWILAEGGLDGQVELAFNIRPYTVDILYDIEHVKKVMLENKFSCIPVVNEEKKLVDVLFWDKVFGNVLDRKPNRTIQLPVVIMAGGKGSRLDPFTKILPKPLIPIGEKTILEVIIDSFVKCGVNSFYLSVNYKSKIIKSYFEELNPAYVIKYIHEDKPLGTAGSLRYLHGKEKKSIIVTNCDIIIKADYYEIIKYHEDNNNDITLVASLKYYNIPYGVCEIENGGVLTQIKEKPEFNFLVNTGMYILKPETIGMIPESEFFHITDLIEKVKISGGKVGVFPISEKSWIDTGEWAEYKKAMTQVNYILT